MAEICLGFIIKVVTTSLLSFVSAWGLLHVLYSSIRSIPSYYDCCLFIRHPEQRVRLRSTIFGTNLEVRQSDSSFRFEDEIGTRVGRSKGGEASTILRMSTGVEGVGKVLVTKRLVGVAVNIITLAEKLVEIQVFHDLS